VIIDAGEEIDIVLPLVRQALEAERGAG